MNEKTYFRNSEGLRLCGVLNKQKTRNCIILCHGITSDKDEDGIFVKLAQALSNAGFAVFRFDFRGHGESEGNSTDVTVTGEKRDLESAVAFLQNNGFYSFGIVAASFAGGAVSLFASEHRDIVKALVLWNATIDYHSILKPELVWPKKYFSPDAMKKLKEEGSIEIGSKKYRIGQALFNEIRTLSPWKELENLDAPILFIHGDKDNYVPYEDSVKYSSLLGAELKTIKGAEHGFHSKKHAEEAISVTLKFFSDNL